MVRTLIKDAYVVTVNNKREIWPGGFIAVADRQIETVGPKSMTPPDDDFDEVIDAAGMLAMPGLINMHQHHWYTLFKGMADGYLARGLGLRVPASRGGSAVARGTPRIELRRRHGDAGDRHDLFAQSFSDDNASRARCGDHRAAARAGHPPSIR